ncbi:hypothetical protein KC322_g27 [Hortaea werneckii]|nr:hypothetical protein KC322_g27 [Hortaea werneckii]
MLGLKRVRPPLVVMERTEGDLIGYSLLNLISNSKKPYSYGPRRCSWYNEYVVFTAQERRDESEWNLVAVANKRDEFVVQTARAHAVGSCLQGTTNAPMHHQDKLPYR